MASTALRVNSRFQEYLGSLELAEDVFKVYKAFDISLHTMMLAVSIVHRVVIQAMRVNKESNN